MAPDTANKRHTEAVQHSSKFPNWRTPPALYAALDAEFQFVLDAAASKTDKLAGHYFGPDHKDPLLRDGLSVNWVEHIGGLYQVMGILSRCAIFVNPPFSRELASAYTTGTIKVGGVDVPHPIDPIQARAMKIGSWLEKCWQESQAGCTIVGVIPYSPQTDWWRTYVEGHGEELVRFHAAREVRKIPHRVSFLLPDGSETNSAGGNTSIVVWRARHGLVAPWTPFSAYWEYLS